MYARKWVYADRLCKRKSALQAVQWDSPLTPVPPSVNSLHIYNTSQDRLRMQLLRLNGRPACRMPPSLSGYFTHRDPQPESLAEGQKWSSCSNSSRVTVEVGEARNVFSCYPIYSGETVLHLHSHSLRGLFKWDYYFTERDHCRLVSFTIQKDKQLLYSIFVSTCINLYMFPMNGVSNDWYLY